MPVLAACSAHVCDFTGVYLWFPPSYWVYMTMLVGSMVSVFLLRRSIKLVLRS